MRPRHLRCEYLESPLGLDVSRPRLSWVLDDDQSAYQIRVTGEAKEYWDSGKVISRQSSQVEYGGEALVSRERVTWAVRVWDREDRVSEGSEAGWWEMGLLKTSDWHGRWIAKTTEVKSQPAPLFRRGFCVDWEVRQARVYLCGLGYYELSINGRKIGDHILDPGYTRYDKRVLYVTYDVTMALQAGRNAIGVVLGTGWYNVHTLAVWNFHEAPWRKSPRFLLEMRIDYTDGTSQTLVSDGSWKTSTGPIVYDSIYSGETYDSRLEKPGWDQPGYDDDGWSPAIVVEGPGGILTAPRIAAMKVMQMIPSKTVTEPKPGVFVFNLGQNFAGRPRITANGPAGTTLVLDCDERLREDGTVDQGHNNIYVVEKDPAQAFQRDTFILNGQGTQTWSPQFTYHGFQYVQMTGFPGRPAAETVCGQVIHTAVEPVGHFECSNELLNRIWRNTGWSFLSNLHGIPTDCPHREKNGWTGDAHLAAEVGIFSFDMASFYTKWLNDIQDNQRPDGSLSGIIPSGGWGYPKGDDEIGPAWDSVCILLPWTVYQYYGDLQLMDRHYETMQRYLEYLQGRAKEYIYSGGLNDWCPAKDTTPAEVTSTGYFYCDSLLLSRISTLLGRARDARRYSELAEHVKTAFNRKFYDDRTGNYANGTQTALSCPLFHGLAEPRNRDKVFRRLVEKIEQDDFHLNTGILGTKYLFEVLTTFGRADIAYRIATQKTFPGWGYWLEQGATTLWERWDGTYSRNHIMFGDIGAWFFKGLAGINADPNHPGFKHFFIRPNPVEDLAFVRAEYQSIHGTILSHWQHTDGQLHLEVTIPGNTTATVVIPGQEGFLVHSGHHTFEGRI